MSDNVVAVKLIAVLAVVILLANLMGLGGSPFASLQNALSEEPDLTTFQDPFALKEYISFTTVPVAKWSGTPPPPESDWLFGCTMADYYQCVESADGDNSFVRIPQNSVMYVKIRPPSDVPEDLRVSRIVVDIQARTEYTNISFFASFNETVVVRIFVPREVSSDGIVDGILDTPFLSLTGSALPRFVFDWTDVPDEFWFGTPAAAGVRSIDVSFVRVNFFLFGPAECEAGEGAWFPWIDEVACAIGQGVEWLLTALQFVVNAVVFTLQYIAGWAVWIGTVIAAFISGTLGAMVWFLDIDAPPVIKGFFAIMQIAIIGFIFLVFIGLVRG